MIVLVVDRNRGPPSSCLLENSKTVCIFSEASLTHTHSGMIINESWIDDGEKVKRRQKLVIGCVWYGNNFLCARV